MQDLIDMHGEMPRSELKAAARERGIKANQSNDSLHEQLVEYDANLNENYDKPPPSGVIPGEGLIELVAPLMSKSHQQSKHAHVIRLVQRVSCESCLDGCSSVRNRQ
ncbi:unnamed protein product [Aphanomyces euteiches]